MQKGRDYLRRSPVAWEVCLGKPLMPRTQNWKRMTFRCEYVIPPRQKRVIKEKIQILAPTINRKQNETNLDALEKIANELLLKAKARQKQIHKNQMRLSTTSLQIIQQNQIFRILTSQRGRNCADDLLIAQLSHL